MGKKRKRNMRDEVSFDAMSTNSSPMKKRKRKDDHNVDVEHTQDTECRQDENAEESKKKKKKKKAKKMKENLENVVNQKHNKAKMDCEAVKESEIEQPHIRKKKKKKKDEIGNTMSCSEVVKE